jgi:hypothetical protein
MDERFGGTYHFHLHGLKSVDLNNQCAAAGTSLFLPFLSPIYFLCLLLSSFFPLPPAARCFLALLILDPEDGCDTFLRNLGLYADYTTFIIIAMGTSDPMMDV